MKTLLIANRKGGVGKSAIACQFAHYLADKRGLRVLVIDLDNQLNTTKAIQKTAETTPHEASALFRESVTPMPGTLTIIPGDQALAHLEKAGTQAHNDYAVNFSQNLAEYGKHYDVCVIDTSPAADIRVTSALIAATHTLAPFQFLQESIDGLAPWIKHAQAVKTNFNPNLDIIGLLPSMVEATPIQQRNARDIFQHYAKHLIQLPDGQYAQIKRSSAMGQAQEEGLPLWKIPTTTARDLFRAIEPTFSYLADRITETRHGA